MVFKSKASREKGGCRFLSLAAEVLVMVALGETVHGQVLTERGGREGPPADQLVEVEGPGAAASSVPRFGMEPETVPAGNGTMYPLDDPFFPGLLLNERDAGFDLGDTSLSDAVQEGVGASVVVPARNPPFQPSGSDEREESNADRSGGKVVATKFNSLTMPPGRTVRRTAMNQARNTGDTILGNLGALRGSIVSPFLPAERFDVPAFRIGRIDVNSRASIGLVGGHYSGAGTGGDEDQIGGFFQAEIGAALREGRRVSAVLDYTIGISSPTGRGRSSSSGDDIEVDQAFAFDTEFGIPQMPKARFGIELDYLGLSGIDRDTGTNVSRTLATGSFMATYAYSRKTSVDWDLSVPVRQFSGGISSGGVTTTLFVNNQITRKTQIGLGVSVGTLKVEERSTQWFEQLLLRANYQPSDFWTFDVTLGLELRDSGGSQDLNPIFGLGAAWTPREGTSVFLAAESRVFNSATVVDSDYRSTSVDLRVEQRIGYRLSASLSLAYENAVYERGLGSGRGGREDNLFQGSLGLHLPITRRWSWELIVSAGKNESNVTSFEYLQGVLQTSFQF